MDKKRYELRQGKFGPYFHDTRSGFDMPLEFVLDGLNRKEELKAKVVEMRKDFGDIANRANRGTTINKIATMWSEGMEP